MPGLRDAITKTLMRLSQGVEARASSHVRSNKTSSAADNALQTGRNLGPYRIIRHLGAGGMGHVYLALHTRLGRHVALKFLPPDLTADEEMLRRLEGEAQAASRLNHPNILTIYDIGQLEEEHYIASEYVDGATLRSALERNAVDPATAIDVVSQVLSALVEAHAAGVVHRDLKPGNIMIRRDGYVKVIDFGLAKQIRRSSSSGSTWTDSLTRLGAIIGTVDYMSPEQARGDPVDHRTDLWSLGVILYEAIARRRPFDGDTENHVIVNILDKPAPSLAGIPDLPTGLSNVIGRALAKDLDKRYQSAREMLADLQAIQRSSRIESSIYRLATPAKLRKRRSLVWAGVGLAVLISLGIAWWLLDGRDRFFPEWTQLELMRQLTFNGRTKLATLSPNGQYLAFVVGEPNGYQSLYLKQIDQSTEQQKIPPRKIDYLGLTFSNDSQTLYETEEDDTELGKLYAIPILGTGSGVPIITDIDGPISFSPDGRHFTFTRWLRRNLPGKPQTESVLYIASVASPEVKKLISEIDFTIYRRPAWAPDGHRIAVFQDQDSRDYGRKSYLDIVDLSGRQLRKGMPGWRRIGKPCWTEHGKTLLVSVTLSNEEDNRAQLREVDLKSGRINQVTKDLNGYHSSVSLTRDGKLLSAIRVESAARIWISAAHDFAHGESYVSESGIRPSLAWFNDKQLITSSLRGGFPNLWLFDPAAQNRMSLTDQPYVDQNAVAVPGTRSIIFNSNRGGQMHLWRLDVPTNHLAQLTFGSEYDEAPGITPDGKWIIYTAWSLNSPHLRKISVDGGEPSQIGTFMAQDPQVSPDGKLIACWLENPATLKWSVAVAPLDGSHTPVTIPRAQLPVRWIPQSGTLSSALIDSRGVSNIWAIPTSPKSRFQQLTNFDDQTILNFAWSPAGDQLACLRASSNFDAVLFKRRTSR